MVAAKCRVTVSDGDQVGQNPGKPSGFSVLPLDGSHKLSKNFELGTGVNNLFDKTHTESVNLAADSDFSVPGDKEINEPAGLPLVSGIILPGSAVYFSHKRARRLSPCSAARPTDSLPATSNCRDRGTFSPAFNCVLNSASIN